MNVTGIIRAVFFGFLCLFITIVLAEPGDELIVQGGIVNLRKGPSIDQDVVLKLEDGRKLYEIRRDGSWVEVRTKVTGGTTGWIHSSLVRQSGNLKAAKKPDKEEQLKLAFEKFKPDFDRLNARQELETGNRPFTNVEYIGNGTVKVTATKRWLNSIQMNRERVLNEIFKLWDARVSSGLPVSIDIVNTDGQRLMVMFR